MAEQSSIEAAGDAKKTQGAAAECEPLPSEGESSVPPGGATTGAPLATADAPMEDTQEPKQDSGSTDTLGGDWYYQESTTKQPAGPWTVEQLRARWRRNQINGLTAVWRPGLEGWRQLSELPDLKAALRVADDVPAEGEALTSEVQRKRKPLDEIPLTHTYTSEQGVLYVYDEVDEDWKASDVYEAVLKEDEAVALEVEGGAKQSAGQEQAHSTLPPDAQAALAELLADTGPAFLSSGPPAASSKGKRGIVKISADEPGKPVVPVAGEKPSAEGPVSEEQEAKRQKRRDYRERKKLKKQAGLFMKAQENPNVYVSGLPPDVTLQELEPVFKRAGVIKTDIDTGGSKIRIYTGEDGRRCKGDALVTYAQAASVELAVKFLHEYELRPQCRICVQQADFQEIEREAKVSKDKLKELAAARKPDALRAKYLAAKNAQKDAVSWSGEMDDGTGRKIIILKHMFSCEEAAGEGDEFYKDLEQEVKEECEKVGQVAKVTPLEGHKLGIVCVKFKSSSEAEECIRVMDGRYFAGRTVEASFYDGKTDLRVLGAVKAAASPADSPTGKAKTVGVAAKEDGSSPKSALPVQADRAEVDRPAAVGAEQTPQLAPPKDTASEPLPDEVKISASSPRTADTAGSAAAGVSATGGTSWEEWLDNQSSDSDEEFRVRIE